MNYFKQVYYEMKHQKMMTWVSISGTALAIFLVMTYFMSENVRNVEFAPETHRQELLVGHGLHLEVDNPNGQKSNWGASLSYKNAKALYEGLEGIDKISFQSAWSDAKRVITDDGKPIFLIGTNYDANFWKMYDFTFLYGNPYDEASCEAGEKKVVIPRSSARKIFNEDDVVGREFKIDNEKYTVSGVIEDVNPLLNLTFSQIYMPYPKSKMDDDNWGGSTSVILLPKDGADLEKIRNQVKGRYATLNTRFKPDGRSAVYHDTPWRLIDLPAGESWPVMQTPPPAKSKTRTYLIYGLLLILPAINLSSMTKGRLRHRISEIGVRRAFGAKRTSIISQLLGENLLITFAGGIIGLVACIIFMSAASSFLFQFSTIKNSSALDLLYSTPSLAMLFSWKNFFFAVVMCLLLNILSATVPAWRASRIEPAVAIAKSKN